MTSREKINQLRSEIEHLKQELKVKEGELQELEKVIPTFFSSLIEILQIKVLLNCMSTGRQHFLSISLIKIIKLNRIIL